MSYSTDNQLIWGLSGENFIEFDTKAVYDVAILYRRGGQCCLVWITPKAPILITCQVVCQLQNRSWWDGKKSIAYASNMIATSYKSKLLTRHRLCLTA
jgi:hypothetical protein